MESAKKVFLVSTGTNMDFAVHMIGGVDGSYNALSAALTKWGRFQLVNTPDQADLIFEIQSTETTDTRVHENSRPGIAGLVTEYGARHPTFALTIFSASPRTQLWGIVAPAGFAGTIKKGEVAFQKSIDDLVDKIKPLAGPTPTTP